MKNEKLISLTAFLLSLSLILLLEAGSLRLLAEDIKPVEREEVAVELLLSASNDQAEENAQPGETKQLKEAKNKPKKVDSREKKAENEAAVKNSSAKNREKPLEKNDQFVEEAEKEEVEAADEDIKAEKIKQENELKTREIEEKVEEPIIETQETENKKKQDTMPAWLNNSKTEAEKDNSKEAETKEEENEDKFDLESFLAELENEDLAGQNNEINKNNEIKSEHALREIESANEEENRENKVANKTKEKNDKAAETEQNNPQKELYDLREGTAGIERPALKNYSQPSYPSNLRQRNIEGKVILTLRIDKEGRTHDLKIFKSSGYDSFDRAALEAVSSWKFKAAEKNGEKVEVIVNLPVSFKLN